MYMELVQKMSAFTQSIEGVKDAVEKEITLDMLKDMDPNALNGIQSLLLCVDAFESMCNEMASTICDMDRKLNNITDKLDEISSKEP